MNSRDLGIVALIILGVLVLLPVLGMGMGGGWGMMGPSMMGGRGMMGYGFGLGPLAFLLLVVGVVLVVLAFTRRDGKSDDTLPILRARLARGEITKEQFEELKQVLH